MGGSASSSRSPPTVGERDDVISLLSFSASQRCMGPMKGSEGNQDCSETACSPVSSSDAYEAAGKKKAWTSICARRNHFIGHSAFLLKEELLHAPVLVLPERQCITAGSQRSVDVEAYTEALKNFADLIFGLPTERVWIEVPTTSTILKAVESTDQVSRETVRCWKYPTELTEPDSSRGLPLYRVEWDWEAVRSPHEALLQMRKQYFCETYVDDESEYFLLERLPKFKHSVVEAPLVFRALWRPRGGFVTRDWVEYICVDPASRSVVSRSCLHPLHPLQFAQFASPLQRVAAWLFPVFGLLRAGAFYSMRFSNPRPGKTGCCVQMCFWYRMDGAIDRLARCRLFRKSIEAAYLTSVCRQFSAMAQYDEQKHSVDPRRFPPADFDLL